VRLQQLQPRRVADGRNLAVQAIFNVSAKPAAITAAAALLPGNPRGARELLTAPVVVMARRCNEPKLRVDSVHGADPVFAELRALD